jgi:hypothetical protein
MEKCLKKSMKKYLKTKDLFNSPSTAKQLLFYVPEKVYNPQ